MAEPGVKVVPPSMNADAGIVGSKEAVTWSLSLVGC